MNRMLSRFLGMLLLSVCATQAAALELLLQGELQANDTGQFREVAFHLPADAERLIIDFSHDGRAAGATLDIGLRDPQQLRGWSGSNKSRITVSATDATPSYLPGPVRSGLWHLIIGVAHIPGGAVVHYRATVKVLQSPLEEAQFQLQAALPGEPAWLRGDFHAHSAHSDGSCVAQSGGRVACPVYRTLEAAVARKLDFITLSDHNTLSGLQSLRELQPMFDRLLVIPAIEVTTVQGHANLLGATQNIDFTLGSTRVPDFDALVQAALRRSPLALVSINHPVVPPGAACIGCGFTAPYGLRSVQAVEVVNGGSRLAMGGNVEGVLSGIPYWEALLDRGAEVTAIGGSDNHDPTGSSAQSPLGMPMTMVWAEQRSAAGILQAVRAGRVYINVDGTEGVVFDLQARVPNGEWQTMGSHLALCGAQQVELQLHLQGIDDAQLEVVNAAASPRRHTLPVKGNSTMQWMEAVAGDSTWLRVDVRGANGVLRLVGNPFYVTSQCH